MFVVTTEVVTMNWGNDLSRYYELGKPAIARTKFEKLVTIKTTDH